MRRCVIIWVSQISYVQCQARMSLIQIPEIETDVVQLNSLLITYINDETVCIAFKDEIYRDEQTLVLREQSPCLVCLSYRNLWIWLIKKTHIFLISLTQPADQKFLNQCALTVNKWYHGSGRWWQFYWKSETPFRLIKSANLYTCTQNTT